MAGGQFKHVQCSCTMGPAVGDQFSSVQLSFLVTFSTFATSSVQFSSVQFSSVEFLATQQNQCFQFNSVQLGFLLTFKFSNPLHSQKTHTTQWFQAVAVGT